MTRQSLLFIDLDSCFIHRDGGDAAVVGSFRASESVYAQFHTAPWERSTPSHSSTATSYRNDSPIECRYTSKTLTGVAVRSFSQTS